MYMKRFFRLLESSAISHAASNSSDGRTVLPQKQLPEAKSYINLLSFLKEIKNYFGQSVDLSVFSREYSVLKLAKNRIGVV